MYNDAPGPFPAGPPTTDYYLGNPKNPVQPLPGTGPDTRNILRIKVVAAATPDPQPAGPILNPTAARPGAAGALHHHGRADPAACRTCQVTAGVTIP